MEEVFCVLVAGLDTGHVDLFPLDWHIVGLEYRLDGFCYFGTDTVTYSPSCQKSSSLIIAGFVPGMRVTVYFPPYFVGLKISDCIVA